MIYTSEQILGFDYVHHYVGNAKASAFYYATLFGFQIKGYQGPETGVRDRVSYLLHPNDLMFLITAGLDPERQIQKWVAQHGDGVAEFSMRVEDPQSALDHAAAKGARVVIPCQDHEDHLGTFTSGSMQVYGDTLLTLLDRRRYRGLMPDYVPYEGPQFPIMATGLIAVDHIVGNVPEGEMNQWAQFFEDVLDFETFIHFDKGDISTQYSALVSKVVRSKNKTVKLPINEPAEGLKKSQIEEYLDTNFGSGVQHVAIQAADIIQSIDQLTKNGVAFIPTPETYYDVVADRLAAIREDREEVRRLGILIDKEGDGYLLQLFTQPLGDRPTLFFEIIQREGSEGFGQNNFQSLFESIEQEQAKRGNL